ncbi:hypothetical protein CVD28_24565 [Bacillus sp. M6-12]|uniref:hypothetical protein n=1 Tax=Bacillus sp. M6-12 TaxID=2054166 RepID=UPI000C767593|nr:hypothetical protein [Bacillus sp. M6-12]PLS15056.1 hypothetical protein CVD28_24565 [Bacillus sp. M6-12]
MNPVKTVTIISSSPVTIHDIYSVIKDALGSYFSSNYHEFPSKNEIVFSGDEDTILSLEEKTPTIYQLSVSSQTIEVVRGMIGYLEEVMEETTVDCSLNPYS